MPEIAIKAANETWSEYDLADGTKLRVRPVMTSIERVDGQFSPDGAPIYNAKIQLVLDLRAATNLLRKP